MPRSSPVPALLRVLDHTRRFRDIAAAVSKLSARTLVLGGEVAIYDQELRSRFDWLCDPDPDAVASPPLLIVFDRSTATAAA
jgi:ATP-dependent DNA ligase